MKSIESVANSYLKWAPMSLAIREVSRINALRLLDKKKPLFANAKKVLDVGCGDGQWWTHIIPNELHKVHGLDISKKEIQLANRVISAQCLDVTASDFIDKIKFQNFDLILGNCSLEHVFYIDKALKNILSILEVEGTFILMVPTPYWALKGKTVAFFDRISPRLSMSFSGLINGFFQHWHLYNQNIWTSVLIDAGFKVETIYGLGNSQSEFLFRLGLPTAFISFLVKSVMGKYLNYYLNFLIPKKYIANKICRNLNGELLDPNAREIFEYMIVCKK